MFTVTDEDRQLRVEGQSWRQRCQANLVQEAERFGYEEVDVHDTLSREDLILLSNLGSILQERTALLRLIYRENRQTGYSLPLVRVVVSQRAIEEAMAATRMKVMSKENVIKLIYRYVSKDFEIEELSVNFVGSGLGLTKQGERYTEFYLTIPVAS